MNVCLFFYTTQHQKMNYRASAIAAASGGIAVLLLMTRKRMMKAIVDAERPSYNSGSDIANLLTLFTVGPVAVAAEVGIWTLILVSSGVCLRYTWKVIKH